MEFGSDFHCVKNTPVLKGSGSELWRSGNFYAAGRQAITGLIEHRGWQRIYIPSYFCYDIVDSIKKTGIELAFYHDFPMANDDAIIHDLQFVEGDVLLRMNYFGLRAKRDNSSLNVDVIEDHSHDLSGDWVENSNADWCVASLRKSLPLAEGGVLWSPQNRALPPRPIPSQENSNLCLKRCKAMELKKHYLNGEDIDKNSFRQLLIETENKFEELPLSLICDRDYDLISTLDIRTWNSLKRRNWEYLYEDLSGYINVLQPENNQCFPFSFVLSGQELRNSLIEHKVYPAILWEVPNGLGKNLLSIPCDARYSIDDMKIMKERIMKCLKS